MARGRGRSRSQSGGDEGGGSARSLVVDDGLAKMEQDDRIPEGEYGVQCTKVTVSDSGWAQARGKIISADDEELVNRPCGNCALMNVETGQKTGIRQLMIAKHWEFLPENENGERSLKALEGEKFRATVGPSKDGRFMNWSPILTSDDYDWRDSVRDGGGGNSSGPKGRSRKRRR